MTVGICTVPAGGSCWLVLSFPGNLLVLCCPTVKQTLKGGNNNFGSKLSLPEPSCNRGAAQDHIDFLHTYEEESANARAYSRYLGTSITLATFQQGLVWSGTTYHLTSYAENMTDDFIKFNSADSYDEHASVMTTFAYTQARGMAVVSNLLAYTKEVD